MFILFYTFLSFLIFLIAHFVIILDLNITTNDYHIFESVEGYTSSLNYQLVNVGSETIMDSNSVITIEANIGETFVLNLDEKPSTGYIWKPIFDNKYLELISEDYYTNSSMPGSSSIHKFFFKGLEKGEHNLKIVYQREWEKTPVKQISYLVKIN